jgi:mono/diheme cytochrome c family protein
MGLKSNLIFLVGLITAACSSESDGTTVVKETQPLTKIEAHSVYILNCASCHGEDGQLGASGAANFVVSKMNDAQIRTVILKGNNKGMMPYEEILTTREIDGLVGIVKSLQQTK